MIPLGHRHAIALPFVLLIVVVATGGLLTSVDVRARIIDELTLRGVKDALISHGVRRTATDENGDFVLTGGEPAALVLIDAVVRLIPGVLGDFSSAMADSFHDDGLLDCPWYTRPALFEGEHVPEELLSGDHGRVEAWRRRQALRRTFERRPDLLDGADLDDEERRLVDEWTRSGASDAD